MTWRSHRIVSGFCGFALGLSPLGCFVLAQASVLPDAIEGLTGGKHRGLSHELALWLTVFAFFFFAAGFPLVPPVLVQSAKETLVGFVARFSADPRVLKLADWMAGGFSVWVIPLGGVLHLLEDMLTPSGVSFLGKRIRFPLLRTGEARTEVPVVLMLVFVMTGIGITRFFF